MKKERIILKLGVGKNMQGQRSGMESEVLRLESESEVSKAEVMSAKREPR